MVLFILKIFKQRKKSLETCLRTQCLLIILCSLVCKTRSAITYPQIHSPSVKLTVQVGDPVVFPCAVHNLGENRLVLWRHGTNIIAGSNVTTFPEYGDRVRLLKDWSLKFTRVLYMDEGSYECIVTGWPPLSVTHTLSVLEAPTLSVMPASGIAVANEGETIELQCIPHGKPVPKITWSLRDNEFNPLHGVEMNHTSLVLEHVTRQHSGLYVCTGNNGVSRPAIAAVFVRVLFAPEVQVVKRRVHGGLSYKSQLVCVVYADPKAEVHWKLGHNLVPLSDRVYTEVHGVHDHEHMLTFQYVCESDFATYTCEATNTIGKNAKYIEFSGVPNAPILSKWEVLPSAKFLPKSKHISDPSEKMVILTWAVECYSPLIDYRLFFKQAAFNSTKSNRLVIPSRPKWKELTIPADWTNSFYHTKAFTLSGLDNATVYEVAIKARNQYGWSPLSERYFFTTFPDMTDKRAGPYLKAAQDFIERQKSHPFHDHGEDNATKKATSTANEINIPFQQLMYSLMFILYFSWS